MPVGIIVVGAAFIRVVVKVPPLHIVVVWFGTTGFGLTVIVNDEVGPVQATELFV